MIPWKNPAEELPEPGAAIWILIQHPNRNGILSCEIIGCTARAIQTGEKRLGVVAENTNYTDRGWLTWDLVRYDEASDSWKSKRPVGWCFQEEVETPAWMEHRKS